MPQATQPFTEAAPHLDERWLRDLVETLCSIHRPTASQGERRAAEWLLAKLREYGARGEIELDKAHGTFWWPLGLAAGAGILAGIATLRGRRLLGAALAVAIGATALDDLPPGQRRFRRLLPQKTATTVVTETGPADAERTIVLVAHHDAAHAGPHLPPGDPRAGLRPRPVADRAHRHEPAPDGPGGGDPSAHRFRRRQRESRAGQGRRRARRGLGGRARGHRLAARRSPAPTTTPPASRCSWRWRGRWPSARPRTCA